MHVIRARNVCEALPLGVDYLLQHGKQEGSRAGRVLVAPGPVATVYARPRECVLFNAVRDANPAFHLIEAMAMLAGRSDAALLNNYISDFGARFAESDGKIHGGYGRRWRSHFGYDQLGVCIEKLRRNPQDRQAVIQMWDATYWEYDSWSKLTGANDLCGNWRDRPCNLFINLRVRTEFEETGVEHAGMYEGYDRPYLDMMTTSRSHDILFGAYGANSVHFALLLKYLAAMIGVAVGSLTMVSWNYHVYVAELEKLAKRAGAPLATTFGEEPVTVRARTLPLALMGNGYASAGLAPVALVKEPESFDRELIRAMKLIDEIHSAEHAELIVLDSSYFAGWANPFLGETVLYAALAMRLWRLGDQHQALHFASLIAAPDWRLACRGWFERRMK